MNIDELLVSQPDTGEQGLEIAELLIRSGALDVVAVDSVAALVPKAEIEGEMGDSHVGLQARLMSQALRKLAGTLNRTDTVCIFTNQLREKIGVMFGNPETTPGGRALKFYSSVRLDIRRIETLKDGVEAIGNRVRVKVVKNKVAPPFKQAEFDIYFGTGISWEGTVLDAAIEHKVVQKSGSYFSFDDERLGQGRQNATAFLREHPDVCQGILQKTPGCRRPRSGRLRETSADGGSRRGAGRRAGCRGGRGGKSPSRRPDGRSLVARSRGGDQGALPPRVCPVPSSIARLQRSGIDAEDAELASLQLTHAGYQSDERAADGASPRARGQAAGRSRDPCRPPATGIADADIDSALESIAPEAARAEAACPQSGRCRATRSRAPSQGIHRRHDRGRVADVGRTGVRWDHDSSFLRRRTSKNRDITTKTPMTSKTPTTRRKEHSAAA